MRVRANRHRLALAVAFCYGVIVNVDFVPFFPLPREPPEVAGGDAGAGVRPGDEVTTKRVKRICSRGVPVDHDPPRC